MPRAWGGIDVPRPVVMKHRCAETDGSFHAQAAVVKIRNISLVALTSSHSRSKRREHRAVR